MVQKSDKLDKLNKSKKRFSNKSNKFLLIFSALLFTIFIFLFSFHSLLYNEYFIHGQLEKHSTPSSYEPTKKLISFFQSSEKNIPDVFSDEKEISHLYDVKKIINISTWILFFSFLFVFIYFAFVKSFKFIFLGSFFVLFVSLFLMIAPFTNLFSVFHSFLFKSGSWIFSAESTLITFYPESFFFDFMFYILLVSLLLTLPFVIYFLFRFLKNNLRKIYLK